MVTTREFLNKLDKRISQKKVNKRKALQILAGKKLNLKWRLKKLSREIVLVEIVQRKIMRKRF
ncbi:hypothetical protein LCGC14_2025260 [marine sediment metagenome]|uniref:Uncharacterized protein n=1 Tax=marine sediment metagenome TaxID=412755 RepID=A0A0F9EWH5_9ZZZZ